MGAPDLLDADYVALSRLYRCLPLSCTVAIIADHFDEASLGLLRRAGVTGYMCWRDLNADVIRDRLTALVVDGLAGANRSLGAPSTRPEASLSQREQLLLRDLSVGMTEQHIARVEHWSERSVRRMIARVKEKLGAPSLFALGVAAAEIAMQDPDRGSEALQPELPAVEPEYANPGQSHAGPYQIEDLRAELRALRARLAEHRMALQEYRTAWRSVRESPGTRADRHDLQARHYGLVAECQELARDILHACTPASADQPATYPAHVPVITSEDHAIVAQPPACAVDDQLLAQFLDNLPVGVCIYDAQGTVRFGNQVARHLLGEELALGAEMPETIQRRVYLAGTDELYPYTRAPSRRALAGETCRVDDVEVETDERRTLMEVWAAPLYDADGTIPYAMTTFWNVTTRKRSEQTLRESQAQLSQAERVAHLGHWVWNVAAGSLTLSDELFRILGRAPAPGPIALGKGLNSVHPGDRPFVAAAIEHSLRDDSPIALETRILRPNGEVRVIESRASVMRDQDGTPVKMLGTALDITERRRHDVARHEAGKDWSILETAIARGLTHLA
jgi:PAS domain S-box-containing protein